MNLNGCHHIATLIFLLSVFSTIHAQSLSFDDFVKSRKEAITELANKVGQALSSYDWCTSSRTCNDTCAQNACSGTFGQDAACEPDLFVESCANREIPGFQPSTTCDALGTNGTLLNLDYPYFQTPKGAAKSDGDGKPITVADTLLLRDICALKPVQKTIVDVYNEANLSTWLYVGTAYKAFMSHPGMAQCRDESANNKFEACGFDSTTRPWYITASSGPRDIVFLFDRTSLNSDDSVLKDAFEKILASTDRRDRIAVIDVTNSDASTLPQPNNNQLVSPDTKFISSIIESIDALADAGGFPDMTKAFALAFNILNDSDNSGASSNCSRFIVAMMGKQDTCFSSCESDSCSCVKTLSDNIAEWQGNLSNQTRNVTIVTFTESTETDPRRTNNLERMARSIVCTEHASGSWRRVTDQDSPDTAMSSFSQLAAQTVYEEDLKVFSSENFSDNLGLGDIFTFAVPIYDNNLRQLLAVAGLDVTVTEVIKNTGLNESEVLSQISLNSQIFRACPTLKDRDACALQSIRGQPGSAICADFLPVENNSRNCFVFGNDKYAAVNDALTFAEAQEYCKSNFSGGSLAIVDTSKKNAYLGGLYSYDGSWIGLRAQEGSSLIWVDGSTESSFQFSYNYTEIINAVQEDTNSDACVTADRRGVTENWNVVSCNARYSFICQFGDPSADGGCNKTFTDDPSDALGINPQNCPEYGEQRRQCTDAQNTELKYVRPFCSQNGSDYTESDRLCCGGRADPDTWTDSSRNSSLSGGAIAGIVVATVVIVGVAVFLLLLYARRSKKRVTGENEADHISPSTETPGQSVQSDIPVSPSRKFENPPAGKQPIPQKKFKDGENLARLSFESPGRSDFPPATETPSATATGTPSAQEGTDASERNYDEFL